MDYRTGYHLGIFVEKGILVDNPEVIMQIIYHYNVVYASYMETKNTCLRVIFLQFPSDIPTLGRKKVQTTIIISMNVLILLLLYVNLKSIKRTQILHCTGGKVEKKVSER